MSCIERPFKYSSLSGGSIRSSWYVSFLYRYSNHNLLYLTLKEVFWYELPRTLRDLSVGVRRLYLPSGVMNQVSDTKNRVVKA